MAGLGPDADRRTDGFSRGMLQRLGLAATIVGRPELLLLDEPCSALDPVGRREVLDLVGRLGGDHTVVFCSHILDDVQEVCDTVGVLRAGRVVFDGRLEELLVGRAAPAYTLRARPPLGPVADALARQPWVTSVEQEGAEVLAVAVSSRTDAETGLARTLADADARLISLVPSGADLERVFLELVR
jgi:ABC-2 type transport system ATP-binding protein